MSGAERIGWLGAGRMGSALCRRLLDGGVATAVWNRTPARCAPLARAGASVAASIGELAAASDVVFVTVAAPADLEQVTIAAGGLLDPAGPHPAVVVDCSTVSEETSAAVRAAAGAAGVGYLAAPVSGNPQVVRSGRAAVVASGPEPVFDRVRPYLDLLAASVTRVGEHEEARLVKLCHNLFAGAVTQALVEATALAEKGGVPRAAFLDFLAGSVLGSEFLAVKGAAIAGRDYRPTFTAALLRKDLDLALAAARRLEVPVPAAAAVYQQLQAAIGHGLGELDYAALYEFQAHVAALPPDAGQRAT